ncbi:2-hydroxyacid dehydrogenase [Flavobacterium xinjiangense]|uniref:D-lactate dehydrogenase n=1 Tax=Flavobacterium xinjiangense TaxID=178356 RepID=A0A1M7NBH1_9FLAO|nr:2-hydroxyacid dehydrogenase [Flavobacterium xinjiangense]SHN00538.1 D-lactate dehydrogenase [Flavobacterium xinjiangense]
MKIAVFSTKPHDREYLDKFNSNDRHELTYFEAPLNADTTNLALGFEAVCIFVNDKIDAVTIDKLFKIGVKLIDLRSAGFNNVDIEAAKKKNIKVMRVPAYSPEAVAEHAVALILTLNRKTHKVYNRVRESNFSLENLIGFNLHGKTVGVIGTGKIGVAFCQIMLGFGCKVIAYDITESEMLKDKGIEYTTLVDLYKNSDIISLHCPLNVKTKYLFDIKTFSKVKKGVMLINTSRGALIKTSDAIDALKNGQLGYLGIDVYEQEENLFFNDLSESIIKDDLIERLMAFHNVLITPHQGFFTKEALDQIAITTLKNFTDFEEGLLLENEVKL